MVQNGNRNQDSRRILKYSETFSDPQAQWRLAPKLWSSVESHLAKLWEIHQFSEFIECITKYEKICIFLRLYSLKYILVNIYLLQTNELPQLNINQVHEFCTQNIPDLHKTYHYIIL